MTELIEYALSLVPLVKGQEPFSGLPSLQAYRLVHATFLAERGQTSMAQRSILRCFLCLIDLGNLTPPLQFDLACRQVL
jgi:hypothetical protein